MINFLVKLQRREIKMCFFEDGDQHGRNSVPYVTEARSLGYAIGREIMLQFVSGILRGHYQCQESNDLDQGHYGRFQAF